MKKALPYIIISVLVIILFCQNCTGEKSVKKVVVPEVKGSFSAVIPDTQFIEIPVKYTVKDNAEINRLKRLYNFSQSEIDTILKENEISDSIANKTTDSLTKVIVAMAKYQEFSYLFENDTLKATVSGLAKGPVKRLAIPEFIMKKRTLEVPEKQVVARFLAGGEVGVNKELNQGTWKINLTVQDKSNNLWSGSFQKIANQDYFLAGFQKSIFTIKK
jgi:hypothetical protein